MRVPHFPTLRHFTQYRTAWHKFHDDFPHQFDLLPGAERDDSRERLWRAFSRGWTLSHSRIVRNNQGTWSDWPVFAGEDV